MSWTWQVLVDEGVIGYPLAAASLSYFLSNVEHLLDRHGQKINGLNLVVLCARGISFVCVFPRAGFLGGRDPLPPT